MNYQTVNGNGIYWHSKLHPCGAFSMGYVKPGKVTEKEKARDRISQLEHKVHEYQVDHERGIDHWRSIEEYTNIGDMPIDLRREAGIPLGLSSPANCHKSKCTRLRRGLKGVTRASKMRLKNAAYIMQKRWGKRRLAFATATLPSMSKEQLKAFISENGGWSNVVRKFFQEVRRQLKRCGIDSNIVGCSEIQEKRYMRRGEIAPHLHFTFVAHRGDYKWFISANRLRAIWRHIIETHLDNIGSDAVIDEKASIDLCLVKKDVVAYLAKYMSKGGKVIGEIADKEGEQYVCTNWVHISLKMRQFIESQTGRLDYGEKKAILEGIDLVGRGYLASLVRVEVEWKGETFTMGFAGRLAKNRYKLSFSDYNSYFTE